MFGIGMGETADQKQQYGALESSSGFATNLGEKDLSASSNFMNDILSGDTGKISAALAPQIGAAKSSAQQQTKQNSMFGTRSGGTAASNNALNDKVHSDITNLVGNLTGTAASSLGSLGSGLLSTGIEGAATGFNQASQLQQQREDQLNDIFKSTAAVAAAPFTGGASLGGLTGGSTSPGQFKMPSF